MKFKLENIKINASEVYEINFELGKLEIEYSLEEMVEMGQNLREIIAQIDQLIETSRCTGETTKDTKEEKTESNTQMDEVFANFADIFSKEKQDV